MTEYIITGELVTALKSAIGTALREEIEAGSAEYSEQLRELLGQLDARPIIETHTTPALSAGWQVSVSYEVASGAFPYVTDRSLVVGAVAELVGADLADSSVTIEQIEEMVEEIDAEYGVYSIPLTQSQIMSIAVDNSHEFLVNHPMGGLIYITIAQD